MLFAHVTSHYVTPLYSISRLNYGEMLWHDARDTISAKVHIVGVRTGTTEATGTTGIFLKRILRHY
jgi:hypothetical protein